MSSEFDDFITDDKGSIFKNCKPKKRSASVIKSNTVNYGKTQKIAPSEIHDAGEHKSNIVPITENDEVIGFVFECSCGETANIVFDFEQQSQMAG